MPVHGEAGSNPPATLPPKPRGAVRRILGRLKARAISWAVVSPNPDPGDYRYLYDRCRQLEQEVEDLKAQLHGAQAFKMQAEKELEVMGLSVVRIRKTLESDVAALDVRRKSMNYMARDLEDEP